MLYLKYVASLFKTGFDRDVLEKNDFVMDYLLEESSKIKNKNTLFVLLLMLIIMSVSIYFASTGNLALTTVSFLLLFVVFILFVLISKVTNFLVLKTKNINLNNAFSFFESMSDGEYHDFGTKEEKVEKEELEQELLKCFKILGISPTKDSRLIKQAYRNQSIKYHPDKMGDRGEEKMKDINIAYDFIKKYFNI